MLAVSTTMFFMGNHVAILVVARILQGASGAFVWTSGTAFLSTRVGADATGAAMGWVTMGTAGGDLFGPIAGGVVFEHFGHFAVFALAATVISIDIILRLFLVDEALEMDTLYSSSTFRGEEEFTRLQESSTTNLDHGGGMAHKTKTQDNSSRGTKVVVLKTVDLARTHQNSIPTFVIARRIPLNSRENLNISFC